jgi:integrase/recombinase XerC
MDIQPYLDYIQAEKRYSQHTLQSYGKDLEQFQVFLRLQYSLEHPSQATFNQIRSWVVHLMSEGNAPRSVNRKISTLRSFYKFLVKKGKIASNPVDGLQGPKTPVRNPTFVPQTSMNILFDQLQFPEGFEGTRDRMILELFYFTGMRRAELLQLKIGDIDFYNQTLRVMGKRSKERLIPMSPVLQRSLEEYISARNIAFPEDTTGLLFLSPKGKKLDPRYIYTLVNKYLANVTTVEKKSPHVLRHTFATHMLNNGADINAIKEILGHASLAATQVYTHNTLEKIKSVYKKAHPKA